MDTKAKTKNSDGGTPNPVKQVKNAVKAHKKVADKDKPAFRAEVIRRARKCNAMQHIPDEWLGSKKKGE